MIGKDKNIVALSVGRFSSVTHVRMNEDPVFVKELEYGPVSCQYRPPKKNKNARGARGDRELGTERRGKSTGGAGTLPERTIPRSQVTFSPPFPRGSRAKRIVPFPGPVFRAETAVYRSRNAVLLRN